MTQDNPTKYKPWGKKIYRRDINRVVEVRAWRGPRGKGLCGTGKALARLAWDRGALQVSHTWSVSQTPAESRSLAKIIREGLGF